MRRAIMSAISCALALGIVVVSLLLTRTVVWNSGHSMPAGLYLYAHAAPAAVGEVVILKNPPRFKLPWLMKRVEGVAGDTFCYDRVEGRQRVNNRLMPAPHPKAIMLAIDVWQGCRVLLPGELVGYGISPDSYDSRYLGPVSEAKLQGVYRQVVSW